MRRPVCPGGCRVQVRQVVVGIGIVGDNRGEGKEENRHRDKVGAPGPQLLHQRRLGHLDPGHALGVGIGQQDNEGGAGADDYGVEKNPEHLHVAL